jgi:3-keto-disaccharide hydrolase
VRRLLILSATLLSCTSTASLQADEGWVSLFDGKSLAGWTPRGGGVWSVDQGTILGVTGTGEYGWLCSAKSYGDFVLEYEAKLESSGNSGVQVRSRIDDKDLMVGYQFDLDRTRPSTGRLYDEARRKLLQDVPLRPEARGALKADDWNKVRVECVGDRLRSWVNGIAIVDHRDPVDLAGILALQVHSGKDAKIRWRNLRIKDLGARRWEPLFNGKDLTGWKPVGEAEWKIQDGALSGRLQKRGYAALATATTLPEFAMRLVFRQAQGKASLSFGAATPDGDAGSRIGLVGGRPQDWNELVVSVHSGRAVVHLNGDRIADLRCGSGEGPAAIEMVGEGSQVQLKSVDLLSSPRRE